MAWYKPGPRHLVSAFVLIGALLSEEAASASCADPSSAREVLKCVLENHPDLKRAQLAKNQSGYLEGAARQLPNPELDAKFGLVELNSGAPRNVEIGLLQPLELGGKRSNRVSLAQARAELVGLSLQKTAQEVTLRALLDLQRLRQIEEELEIFRETVETFRKQIALLRSRPSLTPEQDVSAAIFSLAAEDGEIRISLLRAERIALIGAIRVALGSDSSYSRRWLPSEPGRWPELEGSRVLSGVPLVIRREEADLALANAEAALSSSHAWPELKLGPIFQTEEENSAKLWSLGIALSVQLPVLGLNRGERAYAQAGVGLAEESLRLRRGELASERDQFREIYQSAVEQLRKSRWHDEHSRRHRAVESLFQRGVLSSALVIEAHRQVLEVQKSSHELELKAFEALYRYQILSGVSPEILL